MAPNSSRTKARRRALQTLYCAELTGQNPFDVFLAFKAHFYLSTGISKSWEYAYKIVEGVVRNGEKIDALITQTLHCGRKLTHLYKTDINIIRIAIWEIAFAEDRTPLPVIISEAVKMAGEYGATEGSGSFVNGVLGAMAYAQEGTQQQVNVSADSATIISADTSIDAQGANTSADGAETDRTI